MQNVLFRFPSVADRQLRAYTKQGTFLHDECLLFVRGTDRERRLWCEIKLKKKLKLKNSKKTQKTQKLKKLKKGVFLFHDGRARAEKVLKQNFKANDMKIFF